MAAFEIVSFEGALPLRFGMTPSEVANLIGPPDTAPKDWQATLSYSYFQKDLNLNVGFDGPEQRADHFGFGRGSTVCYRGLDFFHDLSAWRKLVEWSSDYHQHVGFLVFCDLGIALTGFHDDDEDDLAVTVFPRGAWEKSRHKFKVFTLPSST